MKKKWLAVFGLSSFLLIASYQNCGMMKTNDLGLDSNASPIGLPVSVGGNLGDSGTHLKLTALLQRSNIDGCNYILQVGTAQSGSALVPVNKDPAIFNDQNIGKSISIDAVIRTDIVNTCMAGQIVQITSAILAP